MILLPVLHAQPKNYSQHCITAGNRWELPVLVLHQAGMYFVARKER